MTDERGAPYGSVDPKRSFDKVPVQIDWHDYLANLWKPGVAVAIDARIRLIRSRSLGVQFKCTTAGVTGRKEPLWAASGTISDGTVVWTPEAISSASLRSTISAHDWPAVTGLTLSDETLSDLIATVLVDGGTSGRKYELLHQITLANGEEKEGVAVLLVQD